MKFQFLICWLLLGGISMPGGVNGQGCDQVKKEADYIETQRMKAEATNFQLKTRIYSLQEEIDRGGGEFRNSPYYPVPKFNDAIGRYHDDRIKCPIWGKKKDIREALRDQFLAENEKLRLEIKRLEQILNVLPNGKTTPSSQALNNQSPPDKPREISKPHTINQAKKVTYQNKTYSYCAFSPDANLRVRSLVRNGFGGLKEEAEAQGRTLVMAMNAGMYHPNRQPVGLLVWDGRVISPLNESSGKGNFYMQPNGIFGVTKKERGGVAFILKTSAFSKNKNGVSILKLATQSGPILVHNNTINTTFTPNSPNLHYRNGVGVTEQNKIVFVISEQPVNFYEFASLFQALGCENALYLDGAVSRMYLPYLNKNQALNDSQHLGPVLYIVE